jgi:hypothetical protein
MQCLSKTGTRSPRLEVDKDVVKIKDEKNSKMIDLKPQLANPLVIVKQDVLSIFTLM